MEISQASNEEILFDISNDDVSACEEYKEFIKFLKAVPESIKCELSNFLYPFYVYIYMIYLQNKKVSEGDRFVSLYSRLFSNASGYAEVIKALQEFKHIEEFKEHSYFKQFWNSQYNIDLSEESITQMKIFFEESESKLLLFIFQLHILVKRKDLLNCAGENLWNFDWAIKGSASNKEPDESDLLKFTNVLKSLQNDLYKPVNYTYEILSEKKNLCSAVINSTHSQLACGFETHEIFMWNLTSNFLKVNKKNKKVSLVNINADTVNTFLDNDISVEKASAASSKEFLQGHNGAVFGLAMIPQNDVLLSCSEDCSIRVWNTKTFKNVASYLGHDHPVWDVCVSPDSAYFATASRDARMWTFEYAEPLRIFVDHNGDIDCITFHPNSKYIATASNDGTIRIWTTEAAHSVRCFSGPTGYVSSLAFSPDGEYLASADDSGVIKIWDIDSSQVIKEFKAHSGRIFSLSYNRTGFLLATGSRDKYLKVWDARILTSDERSTNFTDTKVSENFKLVDSHLMDSPVHYVNFCEADLLVSVTS